MKLILEVTKLPSNVLDGAVSIDRPRSRVFSGKISSDCVSEDLGVRRINEDCLEIYSGTRMLKNAYGSAIGAFFVAGVLIDFFTISVIPGPYPLDMLLALVFAPISLAALGWCFYISSRNSGDGHVRRGRKTGRIYYVIPDEWRLVTQDW